MASSSTFLLLSSLAGTSLAKSIWSSIPANGSDPLRYAYPIGNGQLAMMPFGSPSNQGFNLNHDSLWSGGPFENKSYDGGNPPHSVADSLPGIRDYIWQTGSGNVTDLMVNFPDYGSYSVLGNLSVAMDGVEHFTDYKRALDLDTGVHKTTFKSTGAQYTITTYCSYPDHVCVYSVDSTKPLPKMRISMENVQSNSSLVSSSCKTGQVSLHGMTQVDIGMKYLSTVRVAGRTTTSCQGNTLTVPSGNKREITFVLAAGTNYDATKGKASDHYSFKGVDPDAKVQDTVNAAAKKTAKELLDAHVRDYTQLSGAFTLDLPDTAKSANLETSELVARYKSSSAAGDPYLESLTFDFGRHLYISSSRAGSLPPNLQGNWATKLESSWGADYHSNINLQMNHWLADQTGLSDLQVTLFDYMTQTWAPRGAETAKLLYNAPGWVTHDEMNIFGHTGMKLGDDQWADYPVSAAWLMQHVWDHFDYTGDVEWLSQVGYPQLLKPIAEFWLSQLQQDAYFKDGTLVVNPCDSPEHPPTSFGCAHWQQLIHQVFETTLQASKLTHETDKSFIVHITSSLSKLDKGNHIGSWGQLQEWKIDQDDPTDQHRHLSHLVGWFPGYSLSSYQGAYTNKTLSKAISTSLRARGPGISDSNAGWEKVWRSACWARLNDSSTAHSELRLTIEQNWAPNLMSMYSGHKEPFQIDANFGFAGAVLSMLVVDLPLSVYAKATGAVRTVVLGPAIPAAWGNGSVKGLRLRGGAKVDFAWDAHGLVNSVSLSGSNVETVRVVDKNGKFMAQVGSSSKPGHY